jgi:hypothetical protein
LAHTQGKKHQANLARRAAKEAKESPQQVKQNSLHERVGHECTGEMRNMTTSKEDVKCGL